MNLGDLEFKAEDFRGIKMTMTNGKIVTDIIRLDETVDLINRILREKLTKSLDIDELVNRFLAWPLPETVCSDLCVTEHGKPHRIGTNLLTAVEARQMLGHVLARLVCIEEFK